MENGNITGYIDVAQITLYVFWAFFFALIIYLRREDRREGYPLEADPSGRFDPRGDLLMPKPKIFKLRNGQRYAAPNPTRDQRPIAARRVGRWPGAPMIPTGNPLVDGVGPAAWAERADRPDETWDGQIKIVPSRSDPHYAIAGGEIRSSGMTVVGADGRAAGTVTDIWVDRAEHVARYLEIDAVAGAGPLLVPLNFVNFSGGKARVKSILGAQFAEAPRIKATDRVTFLEEDRICAYFAGGNLYATPSRAEPLL